VNLDVSGNENLTGDLHVYSNALIDKNLDVSGNESLTGDLHVYGSSYLTGMVYEPSGVTGATGSYSNIFVSGPSVLNGLVYASSGITGATGWFNNLYVDGNTILGNQISDTINMFGTLGVTGPSNLNGLVSTPFGLTGATGSFDNLFVLNNTDVCGNLFGEYMYLTAVNQNYSTYPENSVVPKSYIDVIGSGLKPGGACICATTGSIGSGDVPPSGNPDSSLTDGVQVSDGNQVLVICQGATNSQPTSAINNGLWIVNSTGTWTRPNLGTFSTGTNAVGAFSFVVSGNTYDNDALVQINNPAIVGTDPLLFTILYQFKYTIGQGLNLRNNTLAVDSSLNFINYLDSTPGVPNASGSLTIGGYSSRTFIGPTGPNAYPIIFQPGITGPTGSFTNLYVSGASVLNGLVSAPGGITGATGSFNNLNVSGASVLNGLVSAPGGITGPTGSFTNLNVSGASLLNGLVSAPGGITGATGSFTNLYVSGQVVLNGQIGSSGITCSTGSFNSLNVSGASLLNGLVSAPGGITGATGSFTNLYISGASTLTGLVSAPRGISGATGSFTNLNVSGASTLTGLVSAPGGITGSTGSFTNLNISSASTLTGLVSAPGGINGATGSFNNLNVSGASVLNGLVSAPRGITGATGSFTNLNASGVTNITNTTNSTSTTTGALVVSGGLGIALDTFMGGNLNFTGTSSLIDFSDSVGQKIVLWGTPGSNNYGFGIQTNLLQIYSSASTTRVGIGHGFSGSFTETLSVIGARVGVGITSPECTFQVVNTSTNTTAIQAAFTQTTNFNEGTILSCNGTITEIKMNNSLSSHFTIINDGAFRINNTSTSTAPFTTGTNNLTILSSGNVGIGTTTPTAPLTILANSTTSPETNGVYIFNQTNTTNQHAICSMRVAGTSAGNAFSSYDVANEIGWSAGMLNSDNSYRISNSWNDLTNPTRLTILQTSGNVGIGTTTPSYTLDVNNTTRCLNDTQNGVALRIENSTNMATPYFNGIFFVPYLSASGFNSISVLGDVGMFFDTAAQSIGTGGLVIAPWSTSASGLRMAANGNVTISGTCTASSFTSGSDYRLKTNIEPLLPSRTIDDLKPVEYDLSGNTHDMGFIAHEVEETLPFLVHGEKDGENMQSLNYNGFIALLVKEVQDLKRDKKALEERLDRLEKIFLEEYKKKV
jgi:hypothetical protein